MLRLRFLCPLLLCFGCALNPQPEPPSGTDEHSKADAQGAGAGGGPGGGTGGSAGNNDWTGGATGGTSAGLNDAGETGDAYPVPPADGGKNEDGDADPDLGSDGGADAADAPLDDASPEAADATGD